MSASRLQCYSALCQVSELALVRKRLLGKVMYQQQEFRCEFKLASITARRAL
jgi:hypothetical protein